MAKHEFQHTALVLFIIW